jgi:uncharacterized protein YqjF (DUF2071 family)
MKSQLNRGPDSYVFRQIFWQTWRDLVFVHWEVDPDIVASTLPPALEPDLFNGKAYLGLVPFRMTDIRSCWLPPIPGTTSTLETNLRTYVKRRNTSREAIPAVWFFSLEAQSALAVAIARLRYQLPYFKAKMRFDVQSNDPQRIVYKASSSRAWPRPLPAESLIEAEFPQHAPFYSPLQGSLEHFLVERYALFTSRGDHLVYAQVQHSSYRIRSGVTRSINSGLVTASGLQHAVTHWSPLVHQAQDVIVRIGAPKTV